MAVVFTMKLAKYFVLATLSPFAVSAQTPSDIKPLPAIAPTEQSTSILENKPRSVNAPASFLETYERAKRIARAPIGTENGATSYCKCKLDGVIEESRFRTPYLFTAEASQRPVKALMLTVYRFKRAHLIVDDSHTIYNTKINGTPANFTLVANPVGGTVQYNIMWIKNANGPDATMAELIVTLEEKSEDSRRLASQIVYAITNDIDKSL